MREPTTDDHVPGQLPLITDDREVVTDLDDRPARPPDGDLDGGDLVVDARPIGEVLAAAPEYLRLVRRAQETTVLLSEHQVRTALASLAVLHPTAVRAVCAVLLGEDRPLPANTCAACGGLVVHARCAVCGAVTAAHPDRP